MGVAAYNRGSRAVAAQIGKPGEAAFIRGARDNRISALTVRAEAAEGDLVKARRLIALLRAEKADLRQQITEERQSHASTRGMLKAMHETLSRVRRSWHKASAMLRLLPPDSVQELRAQRTAASA
jgi:predicted  nucleic acid-binding Zn-ribbon protein